MKWRFWSDTIANMKGLDWTAPSELMSKSSCCELTGLHKLLFILDITPVEAIRRSGDPEIRMSSDIEGKFIAVIGNLIRGPEQHSH